MRPFYPRAPTNGSRRDHLVHGLRVGASTRSAGNANVALQPDELLACFSGHWEAIRSAKRRSSDGRR